MDPVSSHAPSLRLSVRLSLKTLSRAAVALVALLLLLGVVAETLALRLDDRWLFGLMPIVSLRYGLTLPTWSLTALFAAGGLLACLLHATERQASEGRRARPALGWLVLAALLLGCSLETFADVGADLAVLLRAALGPAALADLMLLRPLLATLAFSLAAVLGGVSLIVVVRSLKAWRSLPPGCRWRLALGVALLAVAPWIEARTFPLHALPGPWADETLPSSLAVWFGLAQSAFELLGAALICLALTGLLAARARPLHFVFAGASAKAEAGLPDSHELPVAAS